MTTNYPTTKTAHQELTKKYNQLKNPQFAQQQHAEFLQHFKELAKQSLRKHFENSFLYHVQNGSFCFKKSADAYVMRGVYGNLSGKITCYTKFRFLRSSGLSTYYCSVWLKKDKNYTFYLSNAELTNIRIGFFDEVIDEKLNQLTIFDISDFWAFYCNYRFMSLRSILGITQSEMKAHCAIKLPN
jgi:hypothetical protein